MFTLVLAAGLVGLVVAWHQPRNLMGWVLLGAAFLNILDVLVESYTLLDYQVHHGTLPLGGPGILLAPPVGGLWLGGAIAVSASAVISHHVRAYSGGGAELPPYGRRAPPSAEMAAQRSGGVHCRRHRPGMDQQSGRLVAAGMFALPVSFRFGILKYRLYDIDRIISRTLAYAVVTGLPIGVYGPGAAGDTSAVRIVAGRQDAVDLDSVRDDLAHVVSLALEPTHIAVRMVRHD